jgi:collagenase-like PrtC family protease
MHLSVAANYDASIVDELARWPVAEVYGRFPLDGIGGGRPSYMAAPLSRRQLHAYVRALADAGIAFNYLLNASCLGNREWSRAFHRRLGRLMAGLRRMGVRRVTVSTPFLLEAIKSRWGDFHVKAGIYGQIDTPRRAAFWQQLGADAITLESFSINRDLARLRAIRSAVTCDLQLIANHPCLPNCPLQPYHQNTMAHASDGSRMMPLDWCFLRCSRMRLADESLLIKSQWIRPEDLAAYEAIGYDSFKLLERGIPSDELLKRVRAYGSRRFDGNLAELILPYGFPLAPARGRLWLLRHFILRRGAMRAATMRRLYRLARGAGMMYALESLPYKVDSAAIGPDLLDGFAGRDCSMLSCDACGYCQRIAAGAVTVDEKFRQACLAQYAQVEAELAEGRAWGL